MAASILLVWSHMSQNRPTVQNVMMEYPGLSAEDIKRAMHRIVVRYYLRPRYLAGALWRVARDPREAVKFWHSGRRFLRYALAGPGP